MALYDGDMIRHAVCNIDIPACVDETQFAAVMGNVCEALKNLPAVNAIPVEWLEQWRDRLYAMDDYQRECADCIEFVLRLWQKEQEAQDAKM